MQSERTCLRFGSHALSLLVLMFAAACIAHAPVRIELADAEPHAVETTAAALQDRSSRAAVAAHSVEIHPDFTLGFVEFDDQGRAWSRAQGALLGRTLEAEARRSEGGGVLVVLFAPGWRHGAAVCDENVACFRTFLQQIASDLAAVRRLGGGEKIGRQRVVGIYAGWRGRSVDVPVLEQLTFWSRKKVAERIGNGELIGLLTRVDDFVRRQNAGPAPGRSGFVVMGHSMGGTMIYTALSNVLKSRIIQALDRDEAGPARERVIEGFGDLIVLVNPAFEASLYAPIYDLIARFRSFSPLQPPVMITVSSVTDRPNKTWFPMGRTLDTLFQRTGALSSRKSITTAVGNYEPFWSHRIELAITPEPPHYTGSGIGFGGAHGCVCPLPRAPIEEAEARTVIELMTGGGPQVPTDRGAQVRFGRTLVTCVAPMPAHAPFWMFRASDDIVHGHNGFFTEYLADFLRRVITESITARRGLRGREEERPAAEAVDAAH